MLPGLVVAHSPALHSTMEAYLLLPVRTPTTP